MVFNSAFLPKTLVFPSVIEGSRHFKVLEIITCVIVTPNPCHGNHLILLRFKEMGFTSKSRTFKIEGFFWLSCFFVCLFLFRLLKCPHMFWQYRSKFTLSSVTTLFIIFYGVSSTEAHTYQQRHKGKRRLS